MSALLLHPLVSEKWSSQSEQNVYGFAVARTANKLSIKKAVEALYKVRVIGVRTLVHPGKKKARYTRQRALVGRTSAVKKALVKLAEGDMIDFYETGSS